MFSTKSLVDTWINAIRAAEKDKSGFTETGEMCAHFATGSIGANSMWGDKFRSKYLRGLGAPKFGLTINKTFELTSIVGPTLLWSAPGRYITNYERLQIPPQFWGHPEDPEAKQMGMQWLQEYEREMAISETRNALMGHYLNYSQREQPGGGLKTDSHLAILDAMIKGRGVIRVDAYAPPESQGLLTGGFYVSVDDLLIDPDSVKPNLSDAKWIAIKRCNPHWEVERKFGFPDGSLKNKSKKASKMGTTAAISQVRTDPKSPGQINDLVTWYEIFSKCGVGTRFKDSKLSNYHEAFEESVGDYAYLCIVEGMNELLNVKSDFIENATSEEVGAAFDWDIPYYKDNRWPVALLDFWHQQNSCWPMATISMGMGELIFLNVFISSLCDRVYQDSLVKIAIRDELVDEAKSKLLSFSHEVVGLNSNIAGNINELVSFLQRPPVNYDAFRMLDQVSSMFDKRVGLTELLYGLNPGGKVSRTAADANQKGEAVSVRPEHMAAQVEHWQTEIANLERIAAGYSVVGSTLSPLFGKMGAGLWDSLISQADPYVYMREMRSRVEANSLRKPNKARETQNMQQVSGFLLPVMQWYAGTTGNTEPLNNFIGSIGKSMDQDTSMWSLPPVQQEQGPTEEEITEEKEAAEMNKARTRADISNREMKNKKMAHELMEMGAGQEVNLLDLLDQEDSLNQEGSMQPEEVSYDEI